MIRSFTFLSVVVFMMMCSATIRATDIVSGTLNTVQPSTICAGQSSATLSLSLQGTPPFTVEYSDGTNTYSYTTSDSNATISVSPSISTTYTLSAMVDGNDSTGTVSGSVYLTVTPATVITQDLPSQPYYACLYENVNLGITATGSNLQYQWQKDGQNITGNQSATTANLVISLFSSNDQGDYQCIVSGDCGSVSSTSRTLSIAPSIQITQDLVDSSATICPGSSYSFSISASGADLSYQWRLNDQPILNNASAQTSTLVLDAVDNSTVGVYNCRVTSRCDANGVLSASASLNLIGALQIVDQPIGSALCEGSSYTMSVNVGASNASYQWRKDGVDIVDNPTATTAALTLSSITSSDVGSYTVVVSNACQTLSSNVASITLNPSLTIDSQPQDLKTCLDAPVQFSVTATGLSPLYQWRFNGVPIQDNETATLPTLVIPSANADNAGMYDVLITDACGQLSSSSVELSVVSPVSITTQLGSQRLCAGSSINVVVSASGSIVGYQWLKDGYALPGQTNSTLTISNVSPTDNGQYSVQVMGDSACPSASVISNDFNVTVLPMVSVAEQPKDVYGVSGGSAVFTVDAVGVANTSDNLPAYQWLRNGVALVDDASVHGATSDQLTINNITSADESAVFSCALHGACGDVQSNTARIIVPSLNVTEQPTSQRVCSGSTLQLHVSAQTDQSTTLQFQWYKNNVLIQGATDSVLSIAVTSSQDSGDYVCHIILNSTIDVHSAVATVTIPVAPVFASTATTETLSGCTSSTINLQSDVSEGSQLLYQWSLNGQPLSGATDVQYTIVPTGTENNGTYSVSVSNGCSSVSRDVAMFTLVPSTVIQTQPVTTTVLNEGQTLSLSVVAAGDLLQYQWMLNGTAIAGATDASYSKTVSVSDAGSYTVQVRGSCGTVTSGTADVQVSPLSDISNGQTSGEWSVSSTYPNPVHDVTVVRLTSPVATSIRVIISDMQGRELGTLITSNINAGTTELSFDANALQLEDGLYTIRFVSSNGPLLSTQCVVLR